MSSLNAGCLDLCFGKLSFSNVISDYELFDGRKEYASLTAGAYYAARFSVTEHLLENRRQAGALVFLEVHSSYHTPVGVWRVREITRNALLKRPDSFDTERGGY